MMKKKLTFIFIFTMLFTITACQYFPTSTQTSLSTDYIETTEEDMTTEIPTSTELIITGEVSLELVSDIENARLEANKQSLNVGDEVTIIAYDVDGYMFMYWYNLNEETIVTNKNFYTFTIHEDTVLKAVYEEIQSTELPTSEEETSESPSTHQPIQVESYRYRFNFNQQEKDEYEQSTIEEYNIPIILNDAIIASSEDDLIYEGKGIRLRNGYIQPLYGISQLLEVKFVVGNYKDNNARFSFEISFDKDLWHEVETVDINFMRAYYAYKFNEDLLSIYEQLGKSFEDLVYFRITSQDDLILNVDDLSITYGQEGYIDYLENQAIDIELTTSHYPFIQAYIDPSENLSLGQEVSVSTNTYQGYRFSYWIDRYTNTIISYEQNYTFTISRPLYLEAVFERE